MSLYHIECMKIADHNIGTVYLVGAGPGDPELLTVKAAKILSNSHIVVHDGLVDQAILDLIPENATKISVAKKRSLHSVPQDQINEMLIEYARQGRDVVRLKGGDPFIFGRGGEEAEDCKAANVPVAIIPGISAAVGSAAQYMMPLTHRDHSSAVTFVAGQCKGLSDQNWAGLAGKGRTLVIYMGVATADAISEKLIADGLSPDTPIAVIEKGTRPDSRAYQSLLTDLGDMMVRNTIQSPALIIVGDVVSASLAHSDFSASRLTQAIGGDAALADTMENMS